MDANTLVGRTVAGYQLTKYVGEGGTATVYRAEHPERGVAAAKILGVERTLLGAVFVACTVAFALKREGYRVITLNRPQNVMKLFFFDVNHPETNGMIEYFVRPMSGVRAGNDIAVEAAFLSADKYALRPADPPDRAGDRSAGWLRRVGSERAHRPGCRPINSGVG